MSIQEKFEKAVNVIRNLPRNGTYQPSHELQLRFYAFYKQAAEGPNRHSRPNFWEVVKRAKWDAWSKLGNMTKEDAMLHYIDELRKIVETMSYTDNVASFINSLDNFYDNVPAEDLELLIGPTIEKIRSRPNSPLSGSPLASRDTSPDRISPLLHTRANGTIKHITASLETSPASSYSASPLPPDTDDDEDEHFLDTQTEPDKGKESHAKKIGIEEPPASRSAPKSILKGVSGSGEKGTVMDSSSRPLQNCMPDSQLVKDCLRRLEETTSGQEVISTKYENCNGSTQQGNAIPGTSSVSSEAFKKAISKLTEDMEIMKQGMSALESRRQKNTINGAKISLWDLSLPTTAVLFTWPIIILLLYKWTTQRKH